MLPTYQRFNASSSGKIRSFRASERILIFLVFISFLIIVLFGFFLLPDFGGTNVIQAYKNFKETGPQIFIPAPPIHNRDIFNPDKKVLDEKIKKEFNNEHNIEKPMQQEQEKVAVPPIPVPVHNKNPHPQTKKVVTTESSDLLYHVNGADQDPTARKRRDKVKEVSTHHLKNLYYSLPNSRKISLNEVNLYLCPKISRAFNGNGTENLHLWCFRL